jgi:hypothetical protein
MPWEIERYKIVITIKWLEKEAADGDMAAFTAA